MLPSLFGGEEILQKALAMTEGREASRAILRLHRVLELLKIYRLDRYVSFDLGMLGNTIIIPAWYFGAIPMEWEIL